MAYMRRHPFPLQAPPIGLARVRGTRSLPVVRGMWLFIPLSHEQSATGHIDVITGPALARIAAESDTGGASNVDVLKAFLGSLYEYSKASEVGPGSYLVVKHLDGLLRAGDYAAVDSAFRPRTPAPGSK